MRSRVKISIELLFDEENSQIYISYDYQNFIGSKIQKVFQKLKLGQTFGRGFRQICASYLIILWAHHSENYG